MKGHYSFAVCLFVIAIIEVYSEPRPAIFNLRGTEQPRKVFDLVESEHTNFEMNPDRQYSISMADKFRPKRENARNAQVMKEKSGRRSEANGMLMLANNRIAMARNQANLANAHLGPAQRRLAVDQHVAEIQDNFQNAMIQDQQQRLSQRDRY